MHSVREAEENPKHTNKKRVCGRIMLVRVILLQKIMT